MSEPQTTASGNAEVNEVELAQGLGLLEALAIGVGTMIGAGIFVLPGFIIAEAGPAAVLAFLLGGVIAMFCAMSAAEVATGMPKSGGGYYFISRALGPPWGSIIGWGSWAGLVFASAFYAMGFAEYVHAWVPIPVKVLAVLMTVVLVGLNLAGSAAAGKAQNVIVAVLVAVLVLFAGRGATDMDLGYLSGGFMPMGLGAVLAGTATLFVTYCGFGEIASMAEEIRNPGKNLPRALLWSVGGVTALYCVVLFIVVTLRPAAELTGPTIVADLATDMMGPLGGLVILVGAIMATVSSANASIMSASRIGFAMGRDRLMWDWLNKVHPHYRVPHRAITITGALIVVITLFGDIEMLAEAAGLLHLLMYGLICVACIVLRGARLMAYRPVYRVPFFPWIPAAGALGTLLIATYMTGIVLWMGLAIVLFALGHYWFWGRPRTEIRGAWPYYLRRAVLEPALERVAVWGAPEEIPTAVVAIANPSRELNRLTVGAALMQPSRGRLLAVNVFYSNEARELGEDLLDRYHQLIEDRRHTLQELTAPLVQAGARIQSHVPIASSIQRALLSAVEASQATLLLLGWPDPGGSRGARPDLVAKVSQYARAHLLLLREQGPIPPGNILVMVGDHPHADLALLLASRMSTAWDAKLTVAKTLEPGTSPEQASQAESELAESLGEMVRARFVTVVAESHLTALQARRLPWDMVVVGEPPGEGLAEAIAAFDVVQGSSLVLVCAHPERPIDFWM